MLTVKDIKINEKFKTVGYAKKEFVKIREGRDFSEARNIANNSVYFMANNTKVRSV